MIVVRNVFQIKFGKMRDAVALWKDGAEIMKRSGLPAPRLLTDFTGPAYTLILEGTFEGLGDFEEKAKGLMGGDEWQGWYQKFIPLAESGYREILNIVP